MNPELEDSKLVYFLRNVLSNIYLDKEERYEEV